MLSLVEFPTERLPEEHSFLSDDRTDFGRYAPKLANGAACKLH